MDDWMTKVRQALPGTIPAQEYVDRTSAAAGLVGFHSALIPVQPAAARRESPLVAGCEARCGLLRSPLRHSLGAGAPGRVRLVVVQLI